MSNAPVYYALAQAHFNPVAAMSNYVDQIQDRLRREGYPLFELQQITQLVVPGPGRAQSVEPQVTHVRQWLITRSDRTSGFILAPSAITYHTTHYDTHNKFIPELLRGLAAVHEAVTLEHVSRLGLRYLDAVLPSADESVEDYLVGGLHGFEFDPKPVYRLTESVFKTKTASATGTLVARVLRMTSPLGFPPDIQPSGLKTNPKFDVKEDRAHAVIDTDHFVEDRMPIDIDTLREQLLSLHATIKSVFRAMTTDHAHSAWS
ncbi:MAG: TIGR04255 family protein [Acidothermus sp.]|nr:TIGR04255 family protein [Acidothermus sp.]